MYDIWYKKWKFEVKVNDSITIIFIYSPIFLVFLLNYHLEKIMMTFVIDDLIFIIQRSIITEHEHKQQADWRSKSRNWNEYLLILDIIYDTTFFWWWLREKQNRFQSILSLSIKFEERSRYLRILCARCSVKLY